MEILRLRDIPPKRRGEAAAVLVEGFLAQLSALCKDAGRWERAFAGSLNPDRFWVAVEGAVVGIAACSDDASRSVRASLGQVVGALGPLTGLIAWFVIRSELQSSVCFGEGVGYVECVATSAHARGRGVASALLARLLEEAPYRAFVLEVVDTNEGARRIYERLGFREFERKRASNPRQMGFNERIYMRREK